MPVAIVYTMFGLMGMPISLVIHTMVPKDPY